MSAASDNQKRRLSAGLLGGALLALIALPCLVTLPWTMGWTGSAPAPYKRAILDANLLPPAGGTADERVRERRELLMESDDALPGHAALGTDGLGRALYVRLLTGGAVSLGVGVSAAGVAVVIGTLYGALAGYRGGRTDAVMMRIVTQTAGQEVVELLRKRSPKVFHFEGREHAAPVTLIYVPARRRDARRLLRQALEIDPHLYYSVDSMRESNWNQPSGALPTGWRAVAKKK